MSFINSLWVKLFSKQVGADQFGNKYFVGTNKNSLGKNKRYVIYNGIADGSKVPPMWHAWLHYLSSNIPLNADTAPYIWQQEHVQNLTGTKYAYNPNSNCAKLSVYSRWSPDKIEEDKK